MDFPSLYAKVFSPAVFQRYLYMYHFGQLNDVQLIFLSSEQSVFLPFPTRS